MISKENLLKKLKEALVAEEQSIPIYTKHLDSAIFWTGWDKEIVANAKAVFTHLANESGRHKIIIAGLIERIEKDKKDAF
jgi:rubrerythrin